jgi:hypothetical protein
MLSAEQNRMLTEVGADKPMGTRYRTDQGLSDLTLEQWLSHPFLKGRLQDHRHCAGQPKHVREEFVRAMGFERLSGATSLR